MQSEAASGPPAWESIEQLFAALESPLLGYARRLCGDPGVAQDMVQDAFMKLHAQFDEVREPRKWLYRTVHNQSLNHRRHIRKILSLNLASHAGNPPAAEAADPEPLPDETIARCEGIGLVRLSVETLDERSRELIRLKFNENLSYKEIGLRTGLKPGHVGYLLHFALKTVAEELAKNGLIP
jgi:RNA polymerase sigma factor (sigma-70 family)